MSLNPVRKNLREKRGFIDSTNYKAPPLPQWEIHVGHVQLFIVGPGPDAWLACSKPEYRPGIKPGTHRERAIAQRAILILRHAGPDAGVPEIKAALAEAETLI